MGKAAYKESSGLVGQGLIRIKRGRGGWVQIESILSCNNNLHVGFGLSTSHAPCKLVQWVPNLFFNSSSSNAKYILSMHTHDHAMGIGFTSIIAR